MLGQGVSLYEGDLLRRNVHDSIMPSRLRHARPKNVFLEIKNIFAHRSGVGLLSLALLSGGLTLGVSCSITSSCSGHSVSMLTEGSKDSGDSLIPGDVCGDTGTLKRNCFGVPDSRVQQDNL